jgi:hypothetical protein
MKFHYKTITERRSFMKKYMIVFLLALGLSTSLYAYNCSDVTVKIINRTDKVIHADGTFMKWDDKIYKKRDFNPNEETNFESATQNGNRNNTWAYIELTHNGNLIKSFTIVRNRGSKIGVSYPPYIKDPDDTAIGYTVSFNNYQVEPKHCEAMSEVIIEN